MSFHMLLALGLVVLTAVSLGDLAMYVTLPTGGRNRRRP